MQRPNSIGGRDGLLWLASASLLVLGLTLMLAAPAYASTWTVQRVSDYTVMVSRPTSDTAQAFTVYVNDSFPATTQYADGSAVSTSTGGRFFGSTAYNYLLPVGTSQMELRTTNASVLVALPDGGKVLLHSPMYYKRGVQLYDDQGVSPFNVAGKAVPISIAGTRTVSVVGSVSLDASSVPQTLSVDSTLPVEVQGVSGIPRDVFPNLLWLLVGGLGLGLGFSLRRRRRR